MDIKEILFWIFLIFGMGLLIWNVFGNSPSEFITLISVILIIVIKMRSISDRQMILGMKFNSLAFNIKDSFNNIRKDIEVIKNKLK